MFHHQLILLHGNTRKHRRQIPKLPNALGPQRKYFQAGKGGSHRKVGGLSTGVPECQPIRARASRKQTQKHKLDSGI